jgi:tetratricopeptide (TPR) repeat protein
VLRGRYQMRLYSPGSREKAVSYYEQALGVEPGLAVANAELAYAYRILSGSAVRSAKETMPQAEGAARRALAADPNLAEAHAALADILKDRWNWAEAEKEYRHALALNPNLVTAHQGLAIYLSVMGRHEAAAEQIRRARELDPIGVATAVNAGAVYYNARRFEEAIGELNEATVFDPAAPAPWTWIGIVNGGRGRFDAAITAFEKAMKLGDDTAATLCYYAYALARSGKRDQALRVLARLQGSRAFVPDSALAIVYTGLDQKDRALALLEGSYAAREPLLQYLKAEAHFDALRGQRRFQELASRIGLPR